MYATLISGDREQPGIETETRVLRIAEGLRAANCKQGDVICLLLRNDFPLLELMLAAERVGVVAIPLNVHLNSEELRHILLDSGARLLFAHTDLLHDRQDAIPGSCRVFSVRVPPEIRHAYPSMAHDAPLSGFEDYYDWVEQFPPVTRDPVPVPYRMLYTSGTTGLPKGVKRALDDPDRIARMALRVRVAHGLEIRPIRALMPGPLYHSAPNVYALNCLRFGEKLVLMPRFDPLTCLQLIARHRLTHSHMVPTMFSRLLTLPKEVRESHDLSSLKAVVHGASPCPIEIKRAMIEWWGPVILEYYATTEVGIITASTSEQWLERPGTVGRPPEGVEIRVVDEHDKEVAPGVVGEILVRADVSSLLSYHNRPDATSELQRGEWVTFGDLGYVDEDGFLWLTDRKKDLVISGGVNIFPTEVENAVSVLPEITDCVAFGVPDYDLGEVLALVAVRREGSSLTEEQLASCIREKLGALRTPRYITFTAELPREDTGKLARRKVKSAFLEQWKHSGSGTARNPQVAEEWMRNV